MNEPALHVLVVDDSAVVRETVTRLLGRSHGWIVTVAVDPVVALKRLRGDPPDVILLDLEMPRMDGLTFLRHIMATDPIPVVICSGYADHGTETALAALELGAVEIFPKPRLSVKEFLEESGATLAHVLRRAAAAGPALRPGWRPATRRSVPPLVRGISPRIGAAPAENAVPGRPAVRPAPADSPPPGSSSARRAPSGARPGERGGRPVLLGASMGGTDAIRRILETFPAGGPPCVVVQHMLEHFTAAFARRLDARVAMRVREATSGDTLGPGQVLVAPGGHHVVLERGRTGTVLQVIDGDLVHGHRPSVDVLFESAARVLGGDAVAAVLTGMGEDGARGLLALRQAGAATLVQDEATSTVFGMPRAALAFGAAEEALPIDELGPALLSLSRSPHVRARPAVHRNDGTVATDGGSG